MKLRHIALLAIMSTSFASPLFAQPASGQGMGPGAGKGSGMGPCAVQGQGSGMGPGAGMGPGTGMGPCSAQGTGAGMGPGPGGGMGKQFNANKDNTWGYQLMSSEERTAQRDKMRAAKTYEECKALQVEHHQAMEVRAKEKGVALAAPRYNGCDRMKAMGFFK